ANQPSAPSRPATISSHAYVDFALSSHGSVYPHLADGCVVYVETQVHRAAWLALLLLEPAHVLVPGDWPPGKGRPANVRIVGPAPQQLHVGVTGLPEAERFAADVRQDTCDAVAVDAFAAALRHATAGRRVGKQRFDCLGEVALTDLFGPAETPSKACCVGGTSHARLIVCQVHQQTRNTHGSEFPARRAAGGDGPIDPVH